MNPIGGKSMIAPTSKPTVRLTGRNEEDLVEGLSIGGLWDRASKVFNG